jgi:gliding motility-associated-like protein
VFTPNNDGINDLFEIKTTSIRDMEAKIYNLWGNKVYTIEEVGGKWDGTTTGGANAPDGTYFWTLVAQGSDNRTYTREGSVLLLRHAAQAVPNPVRDRVQVKIYDRLDPPVEVKVFSAFGQEVRHEVINNTENIVLDLSNLPGGIYFIKVTDGKGNYFVRIIKN